MAAGILCTVTAVFAEVQRDGPAAVAALAPVEVCDEDEDELVDDAGLVAVVVRVVVVVVAALGAALLLVDVPEPQAATAVAVRHASSTPPQRVRGEAIAQTLLRPARRAMCRR